jgi:hypothetical protein
MSGSEDEREQLHKLEEEFRKLAVADLLVQAVFQISSLGWLRLGEGDDRDLGQARLAIDALGALVGVLGESVPEQVRRDFQQMIANMQLAYARASSPPAGA